MQKKISSSANKIKLKPISQIKLIRTSLKTNSTKKSEIVKTEKKQKKISTEDRYYNSLNHRNGFQSVDNRKMKRKSNHKKEKFKNSEFLVDIVKLDRTVNEIWWKFVNYYNYNNTFKLEDTNFTQEEKEKFLNSNKKKEIDFELKLQTIFNIYKIRKASDNYNLISDSEEGSYLLRHAKIWIIYIKNLIEKINFNFKQTHQIFDFGLEYDADEYMLFDYFITISKEFDEDEIMEFDVKNVPRRFVDIYNNNRDLVLKTLKEEDEKVSNFVVNDEEKTNSELLKVQEQANESIFSNTNDLDSNKCKEILHNEAHSIMSFTDDHNKKTLCEEILERTEDNLNYLNLIEEGLAIKLDQNNDLNNLNENEHDFSFNTNIKQELAKESEELKEEAKNFVNNPKQDDSFIIIKEAECCEQILDKVSVNSDLNLEIHEVNDNQDFDDSFNNYLLANNNSNLEYNIELNKIVDKSQVNPILEESKESENESILNLYTIKDSIYKINSVTEKAYPQINSIHKNEEKSDLISINLITPLKSNLNDKEIILLTSFNKNKRNEYSLKKILFGKDFINDYDEAKLIEPNLRNSGNFAVLELVSKSQEKVGHRYVLTPLKKELCSNKKEYEEAEKDLAEIHKMYSDFIYQPYDENIKDKINKHNEQV